MDPNANLEEMRRLAKRMLDGEHESDGAMADDAGRLSELFEALDGWLTGKGFLPEAWQR